MARVYDLYAVRNYSSFIMERTGDRTAAVPAADVDEYGHQKVLKMKKGFKKAVVFALAAAMVLSMCACGGKKESSSQTEAAADTTAETTEETAEETASPESVGEVGMSNPFIDVDSTDDISEATGISIDAPEGATDVKYSYCQNTDGSIYFVQVKFTLDGNAYCYRCKDAGSVVDISANVDENATETDLITALKDCTNVGAALAGYYYDWQAGGTTLISDRDGVFALNDGEAGFVAWLDVVPGFLYSLSMDDGATQDLLTETAEAAFVPMQGES